MFIVPGKYNEAKIFADWIDDNALKQIKELCKKPNYMTVPAAIKELEKIEMIRQSDGDYRLAYAVTATQKEILKAFNLTATNIREQATGINEDLRRCEGEN